MKSYTLSILCFVAACGGTEDRDTAVEPVGVQQENESETDEAGEAPMEEPEDVRATGPSEPVESDAATRMNAFGWDLWRRTSGTGNNAMSPSSVLIALAMTRDGAAGETAAEMDRVLQLQDAGTGEVANAVRRWNSYGDDENTEFRIVNRLYGEQTYEFEAPFVASTENRWGAPLERVDFKTAFEAARLNINSWVARQTHDRIQELVPTGGIDSQTCLALVNALYFKGKWQNTFQESSTQEAVFYAPSGRMNVPTMHQFGYRNYGENDSAQWLELRYEGGKLAMLFVLPKERDGLAALEAQMSAATLNEWTQQMSSEAVAVAIPRFRVAPAESVEMGDALQAMGMPLAFDSDHADFTAMANSESPADRLYISKVFHKAFVEIDESGTEAAAATAVVIARGAGAAPDPNQFNADHPFLFFIRDVDSGAVLFFGRVISPERSE